MPPTALNLCLHYASAEPSERALTIARGDLRRLVEAQRTAGRRPARLEDYLSDAPPGSGRFTLSFDDAHVSVREHALPVLRELGVTATVFVPTAFVETSDELASWDDLRALRDEGWTVAAHGHTHERMAWRQYDEDEEGHLARLVDDLTRCRRILERQLGQAPRLFAYPYGEDPQIARRAAGRAGFEAAFTVRQAAEWSADPLSIPRLDGMAELERLQLGDAPRPAAPATLAVEGEPTHLSVVVPACDRARILSDVVTRLASQTYPEDRYEVIVVDDGSKGDLSPIFTQMPGNVRCVRQGDGAFRAGQARQRGSELARGSHLVFLDADVAVGPDFLWHLDWIHRRVPGAVLLGYLSGYNLHDLGHLHTPDEVVGRGLHELPIIPDRCREPTLRRCLDNLDWLEEPWTLTYTGNLSVPKDLFDRAGGFGAQFVGWGLEDVDLGLRLHRAGGRFVFGRFAVGYHVVDPSESGSRNPFRRWRPSREHFEGYLANLRRLRDRHADDPAVQRYVRRSLADIDETCGRPATVGVELGGASTVRTRYHRRLHRVQPGGVPEHELLDRVAYADKVGARTLYLLGGAPAEHPAFLRLLRAASDVVGWVSMQSLVHPFAEPGLARRAREAGLRGVVAVVHALDAERHEALHGAGTYDAYAAGLEALRAADLELSAHLVVTPETSDSTEATVERLARLGIRIEELTVMAPATAEAAERATGLGARSR